MVEVGQRHHRRHRYDAQHRGELAGRTNIGAVVAATSDPNNYTFSHTLGGTNASDFTIDSASGQIKVKSALDYETKNQYSVTVTVKVAVAQVSSQSLTLEPNNPGDYVVPVTINVTDVNEPPGVPSTPTQKAGTTTSVTGTWEPRDMDYKPPVTKYWVKYWPSDATNPFVNVTTIGSVNEMLVDKITLAHYPGAPEVPLSPGTAYSTQVAAGNNEGYSAYSPEATLYTGAPSVSLPDPTPTPTPAPTATPTPTPVPTATATPVPTPTATATPTPTLMPTPTLAVANLADTGPAQAASSVVSLFLKRTPAPTPTPAPAARVVPPPIEEPPTASDWEPGDIDPETSLMERAGNVMATPVPMLWVGDSFPLWLLLLLLLIVVALLATGRKLLRRNREY